MQIIRKIFLGLFGGVLFFSLIFGVWVQVGHSTIGRRDTVKHWLQDSGFYERIVDVVLENADTSAEESGQQIPLNDPQIRSITTSAFSPDFIRQNVEEVLGGMYAWLDGETARPQFSVDLSAAKQQLADGLGNYAASRASDLPACTAEQMQTMDTNNLDILTIPCLPPGVNPALAAADLRNEILSNQDFLGDTSITGDDIKIGNNGQETTLDQNAELQKVQDGYKATKSLPLIAGIVALLCVVGIIFLSGSRIKGMRRAGIILLSAGLALGFSFMIIRASSDFLRDRVTDVGGSSSASQELASGFADTMGRDISSLLGWYALAIGLTGLVLIVVSIFVGRNKQPSTKNTDREQSAPITDTPVTQTTVASNTDSRNAAKEKSKPQPPRKIQL